MALILAAYMYGYDLAHNAFKLLEITDAFPARAKMYVLLFSWILIM